METSILQWKEGVFVRMQRVKDIEKVGRMADTPQGGGGFLYVMFPDGRKEIPGRINR